MQPEEERTPTQSRWEKSKHTFEKILEDSQRATEALMRTMEELGQKTKARVERARLQRSLFRRSAELGSRLYEISRNVTETDTKVLEDVEIKNLILEISKLEEALKKVDAQIAQIAKGTDDLPRT
jgi:predicted RNase H-like nuclease (RuvC/YqgF family)